MAIELVTVYTGTIASGASSTSIDVVKGWSRIYAQIGSMSTSAAMDVYGSTDNSTFYQIFTTVATFTTSLAYESHVIGSGLGTNGGIAPVYGNGVRYLQFRASAVVSGGVALSLICSD